ncbi:MAG: hypothetical protein HYY16_11350 [Planctomycetes bacterium]|nr:hypothetical protein [Planctomycetota bacterium]
MTQRTSGLASMGFLSGLLAALSVTVAWFLVYLAGLGGAAGISQSDQKGILLASRILAGVTVIPAVMALAFWLGARGGVRESGGAVLGRGLYRTGVILSALSVFFAFGGKYSVHGRLQPAAMKTESVPMVERAERRVVRVGVPIDLHGAGYTGDVVYSGDEFIFSLQCENADAYTLLSHMAREAHASMVIDREVKGTVTVTVNGLKWEELLRTVVGKAGLRLTQDHGVVRVLAAEAPARIQREEE